MKIIAMIPARLGSKRIIKKNLRLIDGQPLISYIIESVMASNAFDEIYLNSEADVFRLIAEEKGISFYKRPEVFSSDQATNDQFSLDFMKNVEGDILIQILPTSPLLSVSEIREFVKAMIDQKLDTLVSVEHNQIASVYKGEPINFEMCKVNPPSQTMEPVMAYATALMGWTYPSFQENMEKFGAAYHGGDGKAGYFELRGLSTIDIDREEDFQLAQAIISARKQNTAAAIEYYDEASSDHSEAHVESILKKDGVEFNDLYDVNKEIVVVKDLIESMDSSKSWSKRVIDTDSNSMTVISQLPGEGNRRHYHPDWNEWWYIVDGEWEWEIEGEVKIVKKGEIVFMQKGRKHKITASGNKPAIRMAVSRSDVAHVYPRDSDA
ncbi:MAG: CMP-N-acetylneuraminic acid synthetase/quercetin dioxygenase-like cupin family protein [Candidatus Azotimanducaceae bacterium]|jgi:CMP-N-acetylneuraminic acid synthetase/quercetin dioxygenase-like cupin family protein